MKKRIFALLLSLVIILSLAPAAFAGELPDNYTMSVSIVGEHYNVGDSFTADITATAVQASHFASFGFTLNYDKSVLSLQSVTASLDGSWASSTDSGKAGYAINGTMPIAVGTIPVTIAQATFKVIGGKASETVSITEPEMTYPNAASSPTPQVASDSVALHNIKITFSSGANASFGSGDADVSYYAKYKTAGLWSDEARSTAVTELPIATAAEGYRLANGSTENLWTGHLNNAAVLSYAGWEADATLTIQTVARKTIGFAAGENGSLSSTAPITVDVGTALSTVTLPTPTANAGYEFDGWYVDTNKIDVSTYTISEDVTLTAKFVHASYSITFTLSAAGSFTDVSGVTDNKATHGTPVTFKVSANSSHVISAVQYRVSGGGWQTLTAAGGVYTIPGNVITGNIEVAIVASGLHRVEFAAGSNGSVGGTTVFEIAENNTLTIAQLDSVTVTPGAGYEFLGWYIGETKYTDSQITALAVTADTSYTAKFDHASYTVTAENLSCNGATVTHGTDYRFTPTRTGYVVMEVKARVGSSDVTLTKNDDGSYTLPSSAITDAVTISATQIEGSFEFVAEGAYKALEANTKVLIFKTNDRGKSSCYQLGDGTPVYRSEKYNDGGKSYVAIVTAGKTEAQLAQDLLISSVAATDIFYGNLNGDGSLNPADAALINNTLHGRLTDGSDALSITPLMRLQADFNGDKQVTTADMAGVLNRYVNTTP